MVAVPELTCVGAAPLHLPKKVTEKPSVNHIGSSDEPPISDQSLYRHFLMIVFLSGILLIFHGMNKEVNLTIVLGSLVLAVPTCVVIPSCLAFKYYRKLWKEKRDEQKDKRKTYQYDNPFKSETELEL